MDIVLRILVAAATMVLVADNKLAIADFGHDTDDSVVGQTYFLFLTFRFLWDFLSPTFFFVNSKKLYSNYCLVTHCQTHLLRIMNKLK